MQELDHYKKGIDSAVERLKKSHEGSIYDPVHYLMSLPAKRIRPILTLMASDIFDGELKDTQDVALAVELFHNFSLMHDDIMDEAPLRRGEPTVHKKWDKNVAILSGDAMLVMAYEFIMKSPEISRQRAFNIFSKMASEVCYGQQLDMEFEKRWEVTKAEYFEMIKYKTSVLVGASLELGAIAAGGDQYSQEKLYEFGVEIGLAFQIQDDFLDLFGDDAKVGKQMGGDIIAKKKTILLLAALDKANNAQKDRLYQIYMGDVGPDAIKEVKNMMEFLKVPEEVSDMKNDHMEKAQAALNEVGGNDVIKEKLWNLAMALTDREY
ncbi:MAG: polyprenyl synthetase family protein [Flavobacteriales bacterium]|nr:polyprenyl synthetase family protein [Flavobacteriales bacterium]